MTPDPTKWVKATRSSGNGECVEMRRQRESVQLRDTKQHGAGPVLAVTRAEFAALVDGAKHGEFDGLLG